MIHSTKSPGPATLCALRAPPVWPRSWPRRPATAQPLPSRGHMPGRGRAPCPTDPSGFRQRAEGVSSPPAGGAQAPQAGRRDSTGVPLRRPRLSSTSWTNKASSDLPGQAQEQKVTCQLSFLPLEFLEWALPILKAVGPLLPRSGPRGFPRGHRRPFLAEVRRCTSKKPHGPHPARC